MTTFNVQANLCFDKIDKLEGKNDDVGTFSNKGYNNYKNTDEEQGYNNNHFFYHHSHNLTHCDLNKYDGLDLISWVDQMKQ